ncbi:MAG: hypothetical protein RL154_729 [Pseudomonadota bacterium]|jgi:CheY-like chemotaxis protein
MNILIADDSKLNRIVLKELLLEYQKNSKKNLEISEVEDGLKAVEACKKVNYGLIFMDIMMPNMDGISATEIIHKEHPETMIIAVSAVDDDTHKRDILKKGAEDYIQKPINGEVFLKRMAHYVGILESRRELIPKRAGIEVINPFDSNIYNRRLSFLIFNQPSLIEFWDYFMQSEDNETLADLIRLFYGLGSWQVKLNYKFYIFMEENRDFWYFSMTNVKLLNNDILMRIIENNYPSGIFEVIGDRVSFCVPKHSNMAEAPVAVRPVQTGAEPTLEQITPVKAPQVKVIETIVYDFIDAEDLEELLEINDNLRSLMLVVGSSDLELIEIQQIAEFVQKFGRILNKYNEVYAIANVIRELGVAIQNNAQAFKDKSHDIAQLCQAFNNDLAVWLKKLFTEGAPGVDFMDQSLTSDANMLMSFVQTTNDEVVDLDDIFDF